MAYEVSEVTAVIVIGTGLLLALGVFVLSLLILFRNRSIAYEKEKQDLLERHQREMLMAQLETQNQTLQHVAEDLHDHVGQMLAVVWLYLNRLRDETYDTTHRPAVEELMAHTATLVGDVRSLSKSLNTDTIARFGLVACLEMEISRINRAGSARQATMQMVGEASNPGVETEIILMRMVQEALNNALKYGAGTPITLLITYLPAELTIAITDQGPGFSLADVEARALAGSGQGLHNLRRRAVLLGGSCDWEATSITEGEKRGTCVTIRIPLAKQVGTDTGRTAHKGLAWQ